MPRHVARIGFGMQNAGYGIDASQFFTFALQHVNAYNKNAKKKKKGVLLLEQLLNPDPYDGRQVYRNTKQANLLFAQELHRRCATAGSTVSAVAAHPGASATNLFARQLEQAGHDRLARVSKVASTALLQSAGAGALSIVLALDHSTPSGAFVGPKLFGQLRGRPVLLDVYDSAKDPATAARVWELTEQALGEPLPVS